MFDVKESRCITIKEAKSTFNNHASHALNNLAKKKIILSHFSRGDVSFGMRIFSGNMIKRKVRKFLG